MAEEPRRTDIKKSNIKFENAMDTTTARDQSAPL